MSKKQLILEMQMDNLYKNIRNLSNQKELKYATLNRLEKKLVFKQREYKQLLEK